MGGPAAEVFFVETIGDDLESFLRKLGAKFQRRTPARKPKPDRQGSWDFVITPNQLNLAHGNWNSEAYDERTGPNEALTMYVSIRSVGKSPEYWEYLLENDVLPEDLSQVVSLGCHVKGALAYDAVNSLAEMIETSLRGRLRTPAQK